MRIADGQEVTYTFHAEPLFNHLDVAKIVLPRNHRQARNSEEWSYWQAAEALEIEGIKRANYIKIEKVPEGAKVIDAKWVYDLKTNMKNEIVRFKAKLSARGDRLDFEDYGNVYSPVPSWVGIRYFLALTVLWLWRLRPLRKSLAYTLD
jgi:hypothetical protein